MLSKRLISVLAMGNDIRRKLLKWQLRPCNGELFRLAPPSSRARPLGEMEECRLSDLQVSLGSLPQPLMGSRLLLHPVLLTWSFSQSPQAISTLTRPGDCAICLPVRRQLMVSSILPNNSSLRSQFPSPSGNKSSSTNMSTSRSFLLQWSLATITKTPLKTSLVSSHWCERTRQLPRNLSCQKPTGFGSSVLGQLELGLSTLTGKRSWWATERLLWSYSALSLQMHRWQFDLMLMFANGMRKSPFTLTISPGFRSPWLLRFSERLWRQSTRHLLVLHQVLLRSVQQFRVLIGILGVAKKPLVHIVAGMGSAVSVGGNTESMTTQRASLPSRLAKEKEALMVADWAAHAV